MATTTETPQREPVNVDQFIADCFPDEIELRAGVTTPDGDPDVQNAFAARFMAAAKSKESAQ